MSTLDVVLCYSLPKSTRLSLCFSEIGQTRLQLLPVEGEPGDKASGMTPLCLPPLPALIPLLLQISPCHVIPKNHNPDKLRLIVYLSSPEGSSDNGAIRRNLCSVSYTLVDYTVDLAQSLGWGCLLAKLDLKQAYQTVPVNPLDQHLMAVAWNDTTYLDKALPLCLYILSTESIISSDGYGSLMTEG